MPQPNFSALLADVIPDPEFRIELPKDGPWFENPPSAWQMDVQYPDSRMQVVSVRLVRDDPSGALVTWNTTTPPTPPSCSSSGTLSLNVVDPQTNPELRATGVAVVFKLLSACPQRIDGINDITNAKLTNVKGYDLNGNLLTTAPPFAVASKDLW